MTSAMPGQVWLDAEVGEQLGALWAGVSPCPDGTALRDALTDAASGGKRFRPRLLAEVHDALGGRSRAAVATAAAAVELLHTAFVVHDDLIDGDDLRRGRPSVPGRFREAATADGQASKSAAYAVAGAVLTGDLALSAALAAVAGLPVRRVTRTRVVGLVTRALATSAAGELADVRLSFGGSRPGAEELLALAERKTAAYSFMLPMQLGAVLADAGSDVVDLVGESGRLLGTAYQLYDDLAGMFGDPEVTGKSSLADLREGKHTLLVHHARSTRHWRRVEPHWGDPEVTADQLRVVRTALEEAGSRAFVDAVAARHLEAGLSRAGAAGIDGQALAWLASLPAGADRAAA